MATYRGIGMDVANWLRQIGLAQYSAGFARHDISPDILRHLTDDDLRGIGISLIGHRRRLLAAIAALRTDDASNDDCISLPMHHDAEPSDRPVATDSWAERRQITVLFCDIVDSTPLAMSLDPEEMRELLDTYQTKVTAAVAATGGYVARVVGDALLVYFGWPNADEAHAESAVRAGLAIIEAMGAHGLAIRIGIASGLVVIGDLLGAGAIKEPVAVGQAVHLAARLQVIADPDTILVSDVTHSQVSLLFEMEDLGRCELKGFGVPQRVWRVHRDTELSGRSEALFAGTQVPIVGRDEELEFLLRRWRQAVSGDGRVVLMSGEPGIGKSRLLAALEELSTPERHFSLRYFCSPYHKDDALYPIISRWEKEVGFARTDTPEDRLSKLETIVASRGVDPNDIPLLAAMLSVPFGNHGTSLRLSARRQKEMTFDMLIRRLTRLARARPVLVVFEDAHWADPTTLELLEAMIDRLVGLPVLCIVSFRSDFIPPWTGRRNVALLTVGRLDRHHSEMLANQIAAEQVITPALRERIIQQTDGIPLFIEEMTKAVLEKTNDQSTVGEAVVIPCTLQGSLMARLDRLPAAKEVAQISAVIGRRFSHALLASIARLPERLLEQGLHELVSSGLAFRQGLGSEVLYVFKHTLVQDVAYESLPRNRRAELHARVVRAVETDRNVGAMTPSRLGYHCAQAGLIAKASLYYRLAGERSAERAGLAETRNHLVRGLEFAQRLPDGEDRRLLEAELLIALGRLLIAIKGQSDAETCDLLERAVTICRELGDPEMLTRSLFALGAIAMSRGELHTVQTISDELLSLAAATKSPSIAIAGHVRLGILTFHQGRLDTARNSLLQVLDQCDQGEVALPDFAITSSPDVVAAAYLANTLAHLGYSERAIAYAEHAVQRARRLGMASLAYSMALSISARACQTIGDEARCRRYVELLLAAAGEQGFPQYLAVGQCLLGWLTARQGRITAGLSILSEALELLASLGGRRETPYVKGLMADVLASAGRQSEAIRMLDETLETSARSGVVTFDATIRCRKAMILASGTDANIAAAEREFELAIEIANRQAAKLFELQSCGGLARLRLEKGDPADARALLEPVIGWFTEGLSLPHLRTARDVLGLCRQRQDEAPPAMALR
jgi:class 3 adenylate cyclase/tetratricopeptide (TPR) repeat protein